VLRWDQQGRAAREWPRRVALHELCDAGAYTAVSLAERAVLRWDA
jgi:hypothetical protein